MRTHIALLRGINVGGNRLVKMAELKTFLESVGLEDPVTLLQSGNVAFRSDLDSSKLEETLESSAHERFGFPIEFSVRSSAEVKHIIAENPFPNEAVEDPSHLLVVFLKKETTKEAVEALQSAVKGPEKIRGEGRDLYVTYPDGIGTSTVSKTPGWTKLVGAGTGRNWNTILKLAALLK